MFSRGAWSFWARFLFQLSVPTVGKPQLRQHRNELEKQHANRCARIDIFCLRHQVDVPFFQIFKSLDEHLQ